MLKNTKENRPLSQFPNNLLCGWWVVCGWTVYNLGPSFNFNFKYVMNEILKLLNIGNNFVTNFPIDKKT